MNEQRSQARFPLHLAAAAALGFLLGACDLPTGGGGSACRPEDLVALEVVSPTDMQLVDSLSPTLSWDDPGECRPDAYRIRLYSPGPDYPLADLSGEADGSATSWVPAAPLEPGTPYLWQVAAVSGDTVGPFSPESPGGLTTGVFWTGPRCARADPVPWAPPVLLRPSNGEVITSTTTVGPDTQPYVEMTWDDPLGCFPDVGYAVEISRFPDFRSLETAADAPSLFIPRGTFLRWVMPLGWEWEECVPYYWRVKVNLPEAPYSDSRSFSLNSTGAICPPDLGPIITVPPPITLPAGVIGTASLAGWAYMDENVNDLRDPGEGAVSGALLTLKTGLCPGGAEVITVESDTTGRYRIDSVPAGDYCLATSPLQQTLYPESRSLSLGAGDTLDEVNFRYLLEPPVSATPAVTPAPPQATFLQNANCRKGPGPDYDVVTSLLQGQQVDIEGRNADNSTWWWIRLPQSQAHCWVARGMVEASGELSALAVIAAPPRPTATPTPGLGCWVFMPNLQKNVCTSPCPPNPQPGGVCTP